MKKIDKKSPELPAVPATIGGNKAVDSTLATTVETRLEVAHQTMVDKLGREIITAHGVTATKYLQLCLYIRENKVGPKTVSLSLGKLGFKRTRISEINRVAQASDKLFYDYEAKLIGFEKCLEFVRRGGEGGENEPTAGAKAEGMEPTHKTA